MFLQNSLPPDREQPRIAVLLTFRDPMPSDCACLAELNQEQLADLLPWLDMNGLALSLLDNLKDRGLGHWLPPNILIQLERRAAEARAHTGEMIADFVTVERAFHNAGLSYALLKGFSLWPVSVPKVESRSQLDLDYLMAAEDASHARTILQSMGYRLSAVSGRSWEFKSAEPPCASIAEMYKPGRQRSLELHLEQPGTPASLLKHHTTRRLLHGTQTSVLQPAHLFLGQALHLYKHIAGECWRAAHLVELYRHIQVRYHDVTFWREVRDIAQQETRAAASLGLVLLMLQEVMGGGTPDALTSWTIDQVPDGARAWVHLYGRRSILGGHPGTKLYLLLEREMLPAGVPVRRAPRTALLPRALPPAVFPPQPNETSQMRFTRNLRETRFRLSRLRFHAVEGLRYLVEHLLWPRRVRSLTNGLRPVQRKAYPAARPAPTPAQRSTR